MYEDQCIPHVNDPYYAKTKNKGTSTVFWKLQKLWIKIKPVTSVSPPLSALSYEALPVEMGR